MHSIISANTLLLPLLFFASAWARCRPGWSDVAGHCMTCGSTLVNYPTGNYNCRQIDGFLASYWTDDHFDFSFSTCGASSLWLGIIAAGCNPNTIARWLSGYPTAVSIPYTQSCNGGCMSSNFTGYTNVTNTTTITYINKIETDCSVLRNYSCSEEYRTCQLLSDVQHGVLIYNDTATNSSNLTYYMSTEATYACNTGYTMLGGNETRVCLETGHWDGSKPRCVHCQALDEPPNGNITYSTTPGGLAFSIETIANYSCDPGYTLVGGNQTRICQHNGLWDGSPPQCIHCHELELLRNGNVSYNSSAGGPGWAYEVNTLASYSCHMAYTLLNGNSSRTCLDTGFWDGSKPQCVYCVEVELPANGNVTYNSTPDVFAYPVFTKVDYSCHKGYSLVGGNSTRMCEESGFWDGDKPQCVHCPELHIIHHGNVTYDTSPGGLAYNVTTIASYYCHEGYTTVGGNNSRTCQDTGFWDGNQPHCVHCPLLEIPLNGNISYNSTPGGIAYEVYTNASYTCYLGFTLVRGNDTRICQDTGFWDAVKPQCKQCLAVPIPLNCNTNYSRADVNETYEVYTMVNYNCDPGYYLDEGNASRNCLETGYWDGTQPRCYRLDCGPPEGILDGDVVAPVTTFQAQAVYTCDIRKHLQGVEVRTCKENGNWTDRAPVCVMYPLVHSIGGIDGALLLACIILTIIVIKVFCCVAVVEALRHEGPPKPTQICPLF